MTRQPDFVSDIKALIRWLKVIRAIRPQILFVGTPKASLLGLLAGIMARVPQRIYFVHGIRSDGSQGLKGEFLRILERTTCLLAKRIVAVGPSVRSLLISQKLAPARKIDLIGHGSTSGVDLKKIAKELQEPMSNIAISALQLRPDIPCVGFIGRLTSEKGLDVLAEALSILTCRNIQIQVVLVGPIDDESGDRLLKEMQSMPHIIIHTGFVDNVIPYFKVMDIFCLPSKREGLPNVVLEAFASSTLVVGTDVTGIRDLVKHQENGLLVEYGDSNALAETLIEALNLSAYDKDRYTSRALHDIETRYDSVDVTSKQKIFLDTLLQST